MRKVMKARKPWTCDHCKKDIKIGEDYMFGGFRDPRYVEDVMGNEVQDGVEYVNYRLCLTCEDV